MISTYLLRVHLLCSLWAAKAISLEAKYLKYKDIVHHSAVLWSLDSALQTDCTRDRALQMYFSTQQNLAYWEKPSLLGESAPYGTVRTYLLCLEAFGHNDRNICTRHALLSMQQENREIL